MEHGDELQNGIALAERERVRHARSVAVEKQTNSTVEDAFGMARRPEV